MPKRSRHPPQPRPDAPAKARNRLIALEPRYLFDGVALHDALPHPADATLLSSAPLAVDLKPQAAAVASAPALAAGDHCDAAVTKGTLLVDRVAPDDALVISGFSETVAITGSVSGAAAQPGHTVTLYINDKEFTGTIDADMRFSIAVAASDLAADNDQTIEASISGTDAAGNPCSISASRRYHVDTAALVAAVSRADTADAAGAAIAPVAPQQVAANPPPPELNQAPLQTDTAAGAASRAEFAAGNSLASLSPLSPLTTPSAEPEAGATDFRLERATPATAPAASAENAVETAEPLFVARGIENISTLAGKRFEYQVAHNAFGHSDGNVVVQLEASLYNGAVLPEWLDFDPVAGTFSGRPPAGLSGSIALQVTARDPQGHQATARFALEIGASPRQAPADPASGAADEVKKAPLPPRGAARFSDQLKLSKEEAASESNPPHASPRHAAGKSLAA